MTWMHADVDALVHLAVPGYSPVERAKDAAAFLRLSGLLYHDVTVRILTLAENGCEVSDRGGIKRIIKWEDMSYASGHIVRNLGVGYWCEIKVRKWA